MHHLMTEDGYKFWILSNGSVSDTENGENSDMNWPSLDIFLSDMKNSDIKVITICRHCDEYLNDHGWIMNCEKCYPFKELIKLYRIAHPNFKMPEIRLPEKFVDSSYANDEYPSWTLSTLQNDCCDQFCIGFQLWIAYDHQYNDGTWEKVIEHGIYSIVYKNHDYTISDMEKLAAQFPQDQIFIENNSLWFGSNNFEEIINFITVIN